MRRTILALNALGVLLAISLVSGQLPFAASTFEFGRDRDFEGIFEARPYPNLLVQRPAKVEGLPPFSRYLLVGRWKHGAAAETASVRDGESVLLRGSLIYRGGDTLVEVAPGSVRASGGLSLPLVENIDLGAVTLTGEIVDSKCASGVMNPGTGKVHRSCAARCLSGGIPPLLYVQEGTAGALGLAGASVVLAGADGGPLDLELLDFVAEPVEIAGRLLRSGDVLVLRAQPASLRRLPKK
jgi:hypothetical protein